VKKCLLVALTLSTALSANPATPTGVDLALTVSPFGSPIQLPYRVELIASDETQAKLLVNVPIAPLMPALIEQLNQKRPTNNCASYKPDNKVVGPITHALSVQRGDLLVQLSADLELWQCIENPFGSDIKNKVSGTLRLDMRTRLRHDAKRVWVEAELESVDIGGDLGAIAKAYGDVTGRSIAGAIEDELAQAPVPELPLPKAFLALGGQLHAVTWIESASGPALAASMSGELTTTAMQELTRLLLFSENATEKQ
jgi:hypothetical protein